VEPLRVALLAGIEFIAAVLGAITGSTSLVTVPAMILAGMDASSAVGTNMLALVFLSAGATLRFQRAHSIPRHPTLGLAIVSIPGSLVGALVATLLRASVLRAVVAVAVIVMAVFVAVGQRFGEAPRSRSRTTKVAGYAVAAILAVYGGVFSGGYATMLTLTVVACFGTTLVAGIALTKPVNLIGSMAAAGVFLYEDRIDLRVGIAMSVAALVGGWVGAHVAVVHGAAWLRRLFSVVVLALGAKLLYDAL
jgi:uncharacterized membrane protein YfcA